MKAQESVLEHRMQKASATENALIKKGGDHFKKHAIKTKYGFDRVVEDLIQEAMSKGDFNNLSGAGKPLKDLQSQNPYVDFTTAKMNKILMDNGFVPEWITLQKEIRESIDEMKSALRQERANLHFPFINNEDSEWTAVVEKMQATVSAINKKIDKFNLIVPVLDKQMVHVRLDRVADKIKNEEPTERPVAAPKLESPAPSDYKTSLFSIFDAILK
jgi:DnaJ homolog subfamily C member 28